MSGLTIRDIQQRAAAYFEVSPLSMTEKGQAHRFAQPRMIAMVVARELTSRSLLEIGQKFRRDHTTVLHAIARVNGSRFLRDNADRVKTVIQEAPPPDHTVKWLVRQDNMEVRP